MLSVFPCARAQGAVESWVQRYSHPASSSDSGRWIATDSSGDVIVAGYTDGFISGMDFVVLKYSSAGSLLWSNRYNSAQNSTDEPLAFALDENGNIFVAGSSWKGTDKDFIVLSYSSTGELRFIQRYDGPAHSNDVASAMAIDLDGNVIVAGTSQNAGSAYDSDYLIIKYSNAGLPLWTNLYGGPSNVLDQALAVGVHGSGNVFVSGRTVGPSASSDFGTVAYSAAGVALWTNLFNGPGNSNDEVSGMAVDPNGNIFVTGSSRGTNNYTDYATVAYSGTGIPLWTNRYNGTANQDDLPTDIGMDAGGNIFVTGFSRGVFRDYATVAYSNSGVPLWTNRYDSPGNWDDRASAIALGGNGNVFVTGHSHLVSGSSAADYATAAYSAAGAPLWTNRYNGPASYDDQAEAIAVNGSGVVFVTGYASVDGGGRDIGTIAYASNGVAMWTNLFNWPGNQNDLARSVAVDEAGTIYVTGESIGSGTSLDFATIAYSRAGVPLWINRYNGPNNNSDEPNAVAVRNGKVFVTGRSWTSAWAADYATVAYSSAGVPLWTNRYNGPVNGDDAATALAVDANGNVYVTGYATISTVPDDADYLTIAYTSDGVPLWTNTYRRGTLSTEVANAIAVDRAGNVFVTGYSTGVGNWRDYATVAYTPAGMPLWTNRYAGPGSGVDEAYAIAVDGNGNVIVTGASDAGGSSYDYATIKYSNAGAELWVRRLHVGSSDVARALTVDGSGNIFVTGNVGLFGDYGTVAYSPQGTQLWFQTYNGRQNSDDTANAIAVDRWGNVVVTGSSFVGTNHDIVTIGYSRDGITRWIRRYDGPVYGDDQALTKSSLALGPDGSIIVVGGSDGSYATDINVYDFVIIKYETPTLTAMYATPNVEVSWPTGFTGWQLQSRPVPGNASWTNVPGSLSTNRMLFPATNPSTVFRLFR